MFEVENALTIHLNEVLDEAILDENDADWHARHVISIFESYHPIFEREKKLVEALEVYASCRHGVITYKGEEILIEADDGDIARKALETINKQELSEQK